jgi:two-component system, cell cycle response regulator DivK
MNPAKLVLIVDDHRDNLAMYTSYLQAHGYRVLEARDGDAAVRVARESAPDLIVMDLLLPKLDGCAAATLLKSRPETARIPIIAMTASYFEGDREKAIKAGCDAYLMKPCLPQHLLKEVQRMIGPGGSKPVAVGRPRAP